ncbi:MAG: DUF2442 domain-containing protein [Deltaproteobacteria bacterium]|nr:DUF2442 domain-containing protein [Deltaproteobacteria bacterium]
MKSYIEIIDVNQIGDYSLCFTFNDQNKKTVDFYNYIKKNSKGVFSKLLDKKHFKQFKIDMAGGISWSCGADLAPDMIKEGKF